MGGATLASDARVLETVRAIGARTGVDYTDDAAVSALLVERRRAVDAVQREPLTWLGALFFTVGVIWPFVGPEVPALAGRRELALGPAVPLIALGVALIVRMRIRWKRRLMHRELVGYREVLGVARAHGLPLTHVPVWLEGRASGGGGKGAAPIPSYPLVDPPASGRQVRETPDAAVAVPPKPAAVTAYEETIHDGGWHTETGCLLLLAGVIGPAWAVTEDVPLAGLLVALRDHRLAGGQPSGQREGSAARRGDGVRQGRRSGAGGGGAGAGTVARTTELAGRAGQLAAPQISVTSEPPKERPP